MPPVAAQFDLSAVQSGMGQAGAGHRAAPSGEIAAFSAMMFREAALQTGGEPPAAQIARFSEGRAAEPQPGSQVSAGEPAPSGVLTADEQPRRADAPPAVFAAGSSDAAAADGAAAKIAASPEPSSQQATANSAGIARPGLPAAQGQPATTISREPDSVARRAPAAVGALLAPRSAGPAQSRTSSPAVPERKTLSHAEGGANSASAPKTESPNLAAASQTHASTALTTAARASGPLPGGQVPEAITTAPAAPAAANGRNAPGGDRPGAVAVHAPEVRRADASVAVETGGRIEARATENATVARTAGAETVHPVSAPGNPGAPEGGVHAPEGSVEAPSGSGAAASLPAFAAAAPATHATGLSQAASGAANGAATTASAAFERMDSAVAPQVLESSPHRLAVGMRDGALGWVEIRTRSEAGQVSAVLATGSSEAQAALTAGLPEIRDYLAAHHVEVGQLASERFPASAGENQGSPGGSPGNEERTGGTGAGAPRSPEGFADEGGGEELSYISVRV